VAFEAASLGPASPVGIRLCQFADTGAAARHRLRISELFRPEGEILAGAADFDAPHPQRFQIRSKATVISTPLEEVFEKRTASARTLLM